MLMVASMALALRLLAAEQARGRSVREVLRATLAMEVDVGAGTQNAQTIAALLAAIEIKDEDTTRHNLRVAELAVAIGREMRLAGRILRVLARSGLLHDIGKVAIPDVVLGKAGPLSEDEWALVRRHPEVGVDILGRAVKLQREAEIVHAHHERMDGGGYPRGLNGMQIPLEARIIAVADTYDVLVTDRPYRKAYSLPQAIRILREESGTHLYRPAVQALLRLLARNTALNRQAS
jgi:putative nucleotidyltransferase with HDIG domain